MADADLGDLLARTALGDRAAFARLYDNSASKLFGVAMRILGNRSDAEEAVQESYVKIWSHASRYQAGRGSAQSWLVAIARNTSIDALRARRAPTRDIADMPELADAGPNPEESTLAGDDRRRLEACLGRLPADRAGAVRAAYLEGHSYEALARRFDVPLNTMRTWLRRSLLVLRECLAP